MTKQLLTKLGLHWWKRDSHQHWYCDWCDKTWTRQENP